MTLEQIALSVLAGAFGGAGAYGLNVLLTTTDAMLMRRSKRLAFERAMRDPTTKAKYDESMKIIEEMAQETANRLGATVENRDGVIVVTQKDDR